MLPAYDTSNPPEEKTMTIFLGYVFSRMIESSSQVRAAIRIQRFVRKSNAGGFSPVKTSRRQSTLSSARCSVLSMTLVRKGSVPITVAISHSHAASIIMRRIGTYVQQRKYITMRDEQRRFRAEEADAIAAEMAAAAAEVEMFRLQAEEEEARVAAQIELLRLQAEKEEVRVAAQIEMLRLQAEEEEARVAAQIEMLRLQAKEEEEEARAVAAEEVEMLRLQAKEEEARVAAQIEMLRLQAEEEEARVAAEVQMLRLQVVEEEARVAAEEVEMLRLQAEEEEVRVAAQIEMLRLQKEEEEARAVAAEEV